MSDYFGLTLFFGSAVGVAYAYVDRKQREFAKLCSETKTYTGSCHCKSLRFQVRAPKHLVVWNCNCSICLLKKNAHFIVSQSNFNLDSDSEQYLTEYRFNTKKAKHVFCKICGVQAFYVPRSNPDCIAVTFACIPSEQIPSSEVKDFNGQNWEESYNATKIGSKYN